MEKRIGVLIASEQPQVRDIFEGMVKKEGAMVIARARDVNSALRLARHLRPDAALIDTYLPHVIGLDANRLSRTGGLDAATIISGEMSRTQVILMDARHSGAVDGTGEYLLTRESAWGKMPLRFRELYRDAARPAGLIFASADAVTQPVAAEAGGDRLSTPERFMLVGGLGIFAGWFLTLTMVGALVGIPLAAAGALTMLAGLAVRRLSSRRARQRAGRRGSTGL
ncbi:MAG: response regulator [Chloroflexi bacterium]|nr:response regulator [Chloroflexota bacterium]